MVLIKVRRLSELFSGSDNERWGRVCPVLSDWVTSVQGLTLLQLWELQLQSTGEYIHPSTPSVIFNLSLLHPWWVMSGASVTKCCPEVLSNDEYLTLSVLFILTGQLLYLVHYYVWTQYSWVLHVHSGVWEQMWADTSGTFITWCRITVLIGPSEGHFEAGWTQIPAHMILWSDGCTDNSLSPCLLKSEVAADTSFYEECPGITCLKSQRTNVRSCSLKE